MLIFRMGEAALHDDGLIAAHEWQSVQALTRAWGRLEEEDLRRAATARTRCRELRARALRRGLRAGLVLSARRHVALSVALSRASQRLRDDLVALVDQRIDALMSLHGSAQWLLPELQRCLATASPQPVVSIRVCADNLEIVRTWLAQAQPPMDTLAVMADASLSRTCCVVETATGLVRGTLTSQLAAVRQALRDAANSPLQALLAQWAVRS